MEAFCCFNNKSEDTLYNQNPQEISHLPSTNSSLRSSFLVQNKLPSNEIIFSNNINDVLQLKTPEDKKNNPFLDYMLVEKIAERNCSEVYVVKNKKNNGIFVLKKIKRNKVNNITDKEISTII